jgi:hypothetical protein
VTDKHAHNNGNDKHLTGRGTQLSAVILVLFMNTCYKFTYYIIISSWVACCSQLRATTRNTSG